MRPDQLQVAAVDRTRASQARKNENHIVTHVGRIEQLAAIKDQTCQLAVWSRPPIQSITDGLSGLDLDDFPRARVVVTAEGIRDAVYAATENVPSVAARAALTDDVTLLAQHFAKLLASPSVRIRFDATNRQTCPKFHRDHVSARLICTYAGPGTEWTVKNKADNTDAPSETRQLDPFEVAVFKGDVWSEENERRSNQMLLHRSPQIPDTIGLRFAVIIDPAEDRRDGNTH